MSRMPWDQRIARVMVRPLAARSMSPHAITTVTLFLGLGAAALFAGGDRAMMNAGAALFVLARFLDHFDGELARQTNRATRVGYFYDYIVGAISYAALFLALGYALRGGSLEGWTVALGIAGACAAVLCLFLNMELDAASSPESETDAVGYPGFAGFELEDGIYLLAPITWLGLLEPFFVAASAGAAVYLVWTLQAVIVARRVRVPD